MLSTWPKDRLLVYGDESGKGTTELSELSGKLALLVGPEGGFAPEEFALLRGMAQARPLSLGPRVLRADTAALAGLTLLMAHCGDWASGRPRFKGNACIISAGL